MIFRLDERLVFPDPELADESGLLAVGGDLSAERLVLAYANGIFPWFNAGQPILWHSPDPREVLLASKIHVPKSLKKAMRRGEMTVKLDTDFAHVIERCARVKRPGQRGTWITPSMRRAYIDLFDRGLGHSAEAWIGDELVGGLYGVSLGGAFFGESMFADAPDASKIAFATLAGFLAAEGIELIDCQVHTDHLERFGSESWPRRLYLDELAKALEKTTRLGPWALPPSTDG